MKPKQPDCFRCKHFFITWDPKFPRGCHAYGIKSTQVPAIEVLHADGRPCMLFRPKQLQGTSK
ncbi:MAG TPA: uracil-DNA glycosylase [Gammaproteobacteria bacterium]|mgnify:CR=1 FL=1|jgi:hypothetical protein|nr:uracil-DNA glycosylase [Gammaproteobacteria bacterium]